MAGERARLLLAGLVAVLMGGGPAWTQPAAIECTVAAQTSGPAEAFDAYCGHCHKAADLAKAFFAGGADAARRESELSAFLDRHSSCPHRHHEEIAAWLRQLSGAQ